MNGKEYETDVLIIGAGAAGIPAAIGAARAGADVMLVEEDARPGGAPIDQYVLMPDGGPRSGIVTEITDRLAENYPLTDRPVDEWWNFWYLPSDYQKVVYDMLEAEDNITLICGVKVEGLNSEDAPVRRRVTGARWHLPDGSQARVDAKITIDSTGVGNLPARLGADARYGEDAAEDFGEDIAPSRRSDRVQLCTWKYISQKLGDAEPFDFRRLELNFPLESGHGWCRGDAEGLMRRNAGAYLHWGCRIRCPDTRDPAALADTQRRALRLMRPDLESLREHGYAVHLAPRIGVREQWRIIGEAVVTSNDAFQGRIPDDSIMITRRPIDIWSEEVEGMEEFPETRPYGVPYRALIPRGFEGLLVAGKHMSGTHLAMASYRVQCLLGIIGQAAGVAGAFCARKGSETRDADFTTLKDMLTSPPQNVILDPERLFS
ncbi:MAG: FAD-dependent oxidoreductase [Candidatus Brocadiia bacterium]